MILRKFIWLAKYEGKNITKRIFSERKINFGLVSITKKKKREEL